MNQLPAVLCSIITNSFYEEAAEFSANAIAEVVARIPLPAQVDGKYDSKSEQQIISLMNPCGRIEAASQGR